MEQNINKITSMKSNNKFKSYIDYIVFPFYKSLEANTRIDFEFPLTVFIGKNGSGKSSTLKALYGAPKGKSCADYWFSTDLDPIKETSFEGIRNCFYYGYLDSQVVKQRTKRKGAPDYWETSKPVKRYGMTTQERGTPIEKDVLYLDFRGEITAFDKYFYFAENTNKQNYLRGKSKYVKRGFDDEDLCLPKNWTNRKCEKVKILSMEELDHVNTILGKVYTEVKVLKHNLFERNGVSVIMKQGSELNYSEANAGSGEVAVVQLVTNVMKAKDETLILLDEPEVSLHPSAQKRLQEFLVEQIKIKRHQIIVSSHSPKIIEGLPSSAIKLFADNGYGKFKVLPDISYQEAFYDISGNISDKITLICEDFSAKVLLEKILNKIDKSQYFKVSIGGGAESIYKRYIPILSKDSNNTFLFLDGDKFTQSIEIGELTVAQSQNVDYVKDCCRSLYGFNINLYIDSDNKQQKIQRYKDYIDFHKTNVKFFSKNQIPELMILNSRYSNERYSDILDEVEITKDNAKEIVKKISIRRADSNINNTIESLVTEFIDEGSEFVDEITEKLLNIFEIVFRDKVVQTA